MFASICSLAFAVLLGAVSVIAAPADAFDIDAAPLSSVAPNILKRSTIPAAPRFGQSIVSHRVLILICVFVLSCLQ